jgi:transcriptional regulator with XRE-family HTH domain
MEGFLSRLRGVENIEEGTNMSKRSNEKRITRGARVLRFLREQANLSIRDAAKNAGMSMSLVAHLEQGRAAILSRHLEKLLASYGSTILTYQMFESGRVSLPQDLRLECLEIVRAMSQEQLRTVHPVLESLKQRN